MTEHHFSQDRYAGKFIDDPYVIHEEKRYREASSRPPWEKQTTQSPPPQQCEGDILQRTPDDFRLIRK